MQILGVNGGLCRVELLENEVRALERGLEEVIASPTLGPTALSLQGALQALRVAMDLAERLPSDQMAQWATINWDGEEEPNEAIFPSAAD